MASKGLYANINARKKAGTSRPKSESTVSSKAYKNMQAGFPKKMKEGGMLKAVPEDKKKSLGKLPTPVREKMGFMREGGSTNREMNKILTETAAETADRGFKKLKKKSAIQSVGAGALKSGKSYKKRQEDISKKMDAQYKSDVKKFKDNKKGLKEGGMIIVDRQYLKGK